MTNYDNLQKALDIIKQRAEKAKEEFEKAKETDKKQQEINNNPHNVLNKYYNGDVNVALTRLNKLYGLIDSVPFNPQNWGKYQQERAEINTYNNEVYRIKKMLDGLGVEYPEYVSKRNTNVS